MNIIKRLGVAAAMLLLCLATHADVTVTIGGPVSGNAGSTVDVPIHMTNTEVIAGLQFTLSLPTNVTIVGATIAEGRGTGIAVNYGDGKTGNVVIYNFSGIPVGSGLFITLKLNLPASGVNFGDNDLKLTNIKCTNTSNVKTPLPDTPNTTLNIGTVAVESVSLNYFQQGLKVGSTLQLKASVTPSTASNKEVTWSTGNSAVATVSSTGLVTAVAPGKTEITATTTDGGKTAKCSISVRPNIDGFTLSYPSTLTLDNAIGSSASINVGLTNEFDLRGMQCIIELPTSFAPVMASGKPSITVGSRASNDNIFKEFVYNSETHCINIAFVSLASNVSIEGFGGEMFSSLFTAAGSAPGTYKIKIKKIILSYMNAADKVTRGDITDKEITVTVTPAPVDINLTIPEGGYATLCLPFDATLPAGLKAYKALTLENPNTQNATVVLTEDASITAAKPYIIGGAAGTYNFHGVINMATTGTFTEGLLTGVLQNTPITEGFVLQRKNSVLGFYKVNQEINLPAYRCVLKKPESVSGAPAFFNVRIEDDATGVLSATEAIQTIDAYNLNGQKVVGDYKGIVIKNGKKVIIK